MTPPSILPSWFCKIEGRFEQRADGVISNCILRAADGDAATVLVRSAFAAEGIQLRDILELYEFDDEEVWESWVPVSHKSSVGEVYFDVWHTYPLD